MVQRSSLASTVLNCHSAGYRNGESSFWFGTIIKTLDIISTIIFTIADIFLPMIFSSCPSEHYLEDHSFLQDSDSYSFN